MSPFESACILLLVMTLPWSTHAVCRRERKYDWHFDRYYYDISCGHEDYSESTTIEETTTEELEVPQTQPSQIQLDGPPMTDTQFEFWSFENRMRSLIEQVKREKLSMLMDVKRFKGEIDQYFTMLPEEASKIIEITTRKECNCDEKLISPCPWKCWNSCHAKLDESDKWHYFEDCVKLPKTANISQYKCDMNSSDISEYFRQHKCTERTAEIVKSEGYCTEHSVDKAELTKPIFQVLHVLLEPVSSILRQAESKIVFVKNAADFLDSMQNATAQLCQNQLDILICSNDTQQMLSLQKSNYRQMKKNVTWELIEAQKKLDKVAESVIYFKEQSIAQVSRAIKNYACCLMSWNFTVEGFDCTRQTRYPSTPPPLADSADVICQPYVSFLCENRKCIPRSYMCNTVDDCGDNSDELDC